MEKYPLLPLKMDMSCIFNAFLLQIIDLNSIFIKYQIKSSWNEITTLGSIKAVCCHDITSREHILILEAEAGTCSLN